MSIEMFGYFQIGINEQRFKFQTFVYALVISNYFSMMHNVDKPKVDPIFATPPAAEYMSKTGANIGIVISDFTHSTI